MFYDILGGIVMSIGICCSMSIVRFGYLAIKGVVATFLDILDGWQAAAGI